jgi:glycosyltransferase involved in cell wall biosynthesis
MIDMTILFPVLNEEKRLVNGIEKTIQFLEKEKLFNYNLIIVDNGSTDKTGEIGKELTEKYTKVFYTKTDKEGVGIAFRHGVAITKTPYVGYMDIDLSTDLKHLYQVAEIFENNLKTKIINGSRIKGKTIGRKLHREITSRGLNIILKTLFKTKISDCISGFKFFERQILDELIVGSGNENSWFYVIEIMLRAEKKKIPIEEIPVIWTDDNINTKVKILKLIKLYLKNILRLFKELIILRKI